MKASQFVVILCFVLSSLVFSQNSNKFKESELSLSEEKIESNSNSQDKAIENSLKKIFNTIGWYNKVNIQVRNGIVFLDGLVEEDKHKATAINLAQKSKGVIATIESLSIVSKKNIDIDPALEEVNTLKTKFSRMLPYYVSALLMFFLFILLAYFSHNFFKKILGKRLDSPLFINAIAKISSIPLVLLGFYFMIKISGLNALATTLLGGTGAIGLILGLSLKSTLENYVSSLMISLKKIFSKGDVVEINGHLGVVHSVTTTGTTLIDYDGNHIIIPNSKVFSETVKNFTTNPKMRGKITLGIGFEDSIDSVKEYIFNELSFFGDRILSEPQPSIMVDELGSATVNLSVYYWINVHQTSSFKIKSAITQNIKQRLMKENISMPDDAREVVFASALDVNVNQKTIQDDSPKLDSVTSNTNQVKKETLNLNPEPQTSTRESLDSETEDLKNQAQKSDPKNEEDNLLNQN